MGANDKEQFAVNLPSSSVEARRESTPRKSVRRLTTAHGVDDAQSQRYIRQEKILYVSLFLTTLISIALFILGIYLRDGGVVSVVLATLNDLLMDDSGLKDVLEHKSPSIEKYLLVSVSKDHKLNIGHWAVIIPDWILTAFILTLSTSIAGFLAVQIKSSVFVMIFIMFNIANILFEGYVGTLFLVDDAPFHLGMKRELLEIMKVHYHDPFSGTMFSNTFNTVMVVGRCCGINGPQDFLTYTNTSTDTTYFRHVDFCCKPGLWNKARIVNGEVETECSMIDVKVGSKNMMRDGCFHVWADKFFGAVYVPIIMFSSILVVLQTIQILISIIILRWTNFVEREIMEAMKNEEDNNSPPPSQPTSKSNISNPTVISTPIIRNDVVAFSPYVNTPSSALALYKSTNVDSI